MPTMPNPGIRRRPGLWSGAIIGLVALIFAAASTAVAQAEDSATSEVGHPSGTDAHWAAMMIPHHEDGIVLTELALQRSENEGVREVAAESMRDQQSELPELQAVAEAGGLDPIPPESPLQRFNEQQMQMLRSLSGAEFDRAWLDVFSSHHMSAIMMTDVALAGTAGGEAERLQRQIHDGQLRQVARMNHLRDHLQEQ